jgi:hypothetical protein
VVLLTISVHFNEQTASAYPSLATLAAYLGRSERTVMRAVDELVRRGLVERQYRYIHGRQTSTAYLLKFNRWGGEGDTSVTPGGDTGDTPGGDTGDTQTGLHGQDHREHKIPPTPRKRGDDSDQAQGGRRTNPANVRARELGIPVAQARVELEREERHGKVREAIRDACKVPGRNEAPLTRHVEVLRAHGWVPDDQVIRDYLREYGPARAGMLHGPVTWEPPAILEPWHVLWGVDHYARDMVPNAFLEERGTGYWLNCAILRVLDAA